MALRKKINETKRKHFQKKLQTAKKNPKRTWEIIKEIAQYKDIKEEKKLKNPLETATNFNTFFSEVGAKVFDEVSKFTTHKPVDVGLNPAQLLNTTNTWKPNPVRLQKIRRILYSLKNTKAVKHDNISLQYIKDSFNFTTPLLHLIINTSIATNKFPDQWKLSVIKPLHKAGDINTASNYRPISLLPVLSKILEKVISNQLLTHLDKSNLLHPNQYAYRKHTNTQDALLNITEKIYSDIDTKNVTQLLLLDLSKAFDSVEHTRLLQKISNLGIATQWFQSNLANRSHAVRLENTISSPIQNDFGVPQGFILGPLLFSIFINDFPPMPSNTRIFMYADDVQIAMTSAPVKPSQTKSDAEILLKHVKSWYGQNGLKLNASKTVHHFSFQEHNKKAPKFNFNVRNNIIEPVGKGKNLGVWFDQNMSFTSHVEKTCSKISGTLMFLHRVKNVLDEKTRLLDIQSIVLSRFDYCDLVWGDIPKGLQKELQKCMDFAAKVVCKGNFRKNDHATPLVEKLNWTPIEQRVLIHKVKYVFFSLYRPQSSANVVKFYPPTTKGVKHDRRHDVNISFRSSDAGQRALSISGALLWNKLPMHMKINQSIKNFKKNVTSFSHIRVANKYRNLSSYA
ncbi:Reverse transcriptase domain [Trinorchestia longiramus]|nr:Reverse transcriptase domain [Trinorchestia longiramus]